MRSGCASWRKETANFLPPLGEEYAALPLQGVGRSWMRVKASKASSPPDCKQPSLHCNQTCPPHVRGCPPHKLRSVDKAIIFRLNDSPNRRSLQVSKGNAFTASSGSNHLKGMGKVKPDRGGSDARSSVGKHALQVLRNRYWRTADAVSGAPSSAGSMWTGKGNGEACFPTQEGKWTEPEPAADPGRERSPQGNSVLTGKQRTALGTARRKGKHLRMPNRTPDGTTRQPGSTG